MKNLGNILMAAGALVVLAAAFFSGVPVRIALLAGVASFGVGYYFERFTAYGGSGK